MKFELSRGYLISALKQNLKTSFPKFDNMKSFLYHVRQLFGVYPRRIWQGIHVLKGIIMTTYFALPFFTTRRGARNFDAIVVSLSFVTAVLSFSSVFSVSDSNTLSGLVDCFL